ncbi:hypothetical protein ACFOEW_16115 [Alteromonas oceani]|uniref:Uncharacterized protein n=1 Tax=Alteromonas oceani TaxID=2071609 RepID=A0ABV7K424_9ALTE|nr:hypothetical protein [Alteromonas oceani]
MYNFDLDVLPGDFIVEYESDLCEELKDAKLHQGMKTDFLYDGDDPLVDGISMIWPELLDSNGHIIEDRTPGTAPTKGIAIMWIVREETKSYHAKRIKVGTKGYWVRGPFRVANVTVISVGDLAR